MSPERSESTNSYQGSASRDASPPRRSVLRILASIPFYLFGVIYCLMFVRTPERVLEAWSRYSSDEGVSILGDAAFAESLWRSTVIPLIGLGLLLIGYGISTRKRTVTLIAAGCVFVVFVVGSGLLR